MTQNMKVPLKLATDLRNLNVNTEIYFFKGYLHYMNIFSLLVFISYKSILYDYFFNPFFVFNIHIKENK